MPRNRYLTDKEHPRPLANRENTARLSEILSELIDVMDVAMWELDLDYAIRSCNHKARQYYGQDIIGRRCFDVVSKNDIACPECAAKQVYKGAASGRSEHTRYDTDGVAHHIDHIATPIHNDQGSLTGVLVLIIDITQRKQLEAALKTYQHQLEALVENRTKALMQSNEKYRALIMQSSDCLILHDMEGSILEVNPCSCATYGYTREELLRMKVSDLDPDYYEREQGGAFWQRASLREPMIFIARQIKKDGTIFPVEVSLTLVEIDQDTLVLGLCRDISERERNQAEKERLEEQFYQAQKLESIGRLAGGVAHDLNNLLGPILGYSELLLEDGPDRAAKKEWLEEITKAGKRARNLVHQLLAFSRKQKLEVKPLLLNIVLGDFENLLRRTIREDITLKLILADNLPPVKADAGQLEQVVMNLAVNAQDAMPHGGKLTIETASVTLDEAYARQHEDAVPGTYAMIAVSDSGCGMNASTLEHIFEPFFTTKGKDVGTGLGLSTVYGIIKQHGGNIWVYSEPDMGTTFKIYLPIYQEPIEADSDEYAAEPELTGKETVLLVEDDINVRKLSQQILERKGYKVLDAGGGPEALEMLDQYSGEVHLLLSDVVMPIMNGKQLADNVAIKYPDIKVVFMSGYTDNVIARHGILDPQINFIAKPFSNQGLLAKVREVLDKT